MADDEWPDCTVCGEETNQCLYLYRGVPSEYGVDAVCDDCWHEVVDDIDYKRTLSSLRGWL